MDQQKHRYVIVLAGGGGKRLWPLSRAHRPKQLLPFAGPTTLLELTLERVQSNDLSVHYLVATTAEYEGVIRSLVGSKVDDIIVEPVAKNTAPAILLSCLHIAQRDPEATIFFVPSDHYIPDLVSFRTAMAQAFDAAEQHQEIILLGITQQKITTTLGFIELGTPITQGSNLYHVDRFHEKPSGEDATRYFARTDMVWNGGMVCASVGVLINAFAKHAKDMYEGIHAYGSLPSASFDYAILEKMDALIALKVDFSWQDMGSLQTFIPASVSEEKVIALYGSERNLVWSEKPVIIAGLSDICIVAMDDVLVVMRRDLASHADELARQVVDRGLSECM